MCSARKVKIRYSVWEKKQQGQFEQVDLTVLINKNRAPFQETGRLNAAIAQILLMNMEKYYDICINQFKDSMKQIDIGNFLYEQKGENGIERVWGEEKKDGSRDQPYWIVGNVQGLNHMRWAVSTTDSKDKEALKHSQYFATSNVVSIKFGNDIFELRYK